jgi:hypothetical protein
MNFNYQIERQELLTSIMIEDTIEATFDNLRDWLMVCNPTNKELKNLLDELRLSNKIKNELYENGVTK